MQQNQIFEATARIRQMESLFDQLQNADFREDLSFEDSLRTLKQYYENGLWLHDYELDEQGLLPPELKRGVLSQDAVYDFLNRITCEGITETAFR